MGNSDDTNGEWSLFILLRPWLCMCWSRRPNSWILLSSIHLNRRWGRLDRELHHDRRARVVQEVLRCIHQSGLNLVDPQLLEDIGGRLEVAEQNAASVVPGAHVSWLVLLVLIEALQFMAFPFAVVGWDENSSLGFVPQAFRLGLPLHKEGKPFEIFLWVVFSPMLVLLSLGIAGVLMWTLSWITRGFHWAGIRLPTVLSECYYLVIKTGVGLYMRIQELVVEFGAMFMFAVVLLPFLCSGSSMESLPSVKCWQGCPHLVYICLSVLQLLLHFTAIFHNNLPIYSMKWFWDGRTTRTDVHGNAEKYFPKDDYMIFVSQASLYDPTILSDTGLQVFDVDRPLFSSTWSTVSGMLKFLVAASLVFCGRKDGYEWALLSVGTLCYILLLVMNIFMSPCTYHWINCSRNLSLVAGLWAIACGFAAAGLEIEESPFLATVFVIGVLLIIFATPGILFYGRRSIQSDLQTSEVLRHSLLHSYQKTVVLFRLLSMRMSLDGGVEGSNSVGIYMVKGLDVVRPTGSLFQGSVKRLKVDADQWASWSKQGSGVGVVSCCPCCTCPTTTNLEDNSLSDTAKIPDRGGRESRPGGRHCDIRGNVAKKVRLWMESADLIVDPDRDVELGLSVPLDAYFSTEDGIPKYTGDGPHSFSGICNATPWTPRLGHRSLPSFLPSEYSPRMKRALKPTNYGDEGPSHRHINVHTDQSLGAPCGSNEPLVSVPQTLYSSIEKPHSSAFGPEHKSEEFKGQRRLKSSDFVHDPEVYWEENEMQG